MKNLLPGNKLQTTFGSKEYRVINRSGPRVTIEDPESGKSYDRNVSHLKKTPVAVQIHTDEAPVLAPQSDESQQAELQYADDTSSEEDFRGFEESALTTETRSYQLPAKEKRARKLPSRFNDYQL